jgi:hypothetical protein
VNRFEWDGLRPGDEVFVHDPPTGDGPAQRGTVLYLTVQVRRPNEIGVRLDDGAVVWPSARTVHHDRVAPLGSCWRCADVQRHQPA